MKKLLKIVGIVLVIIIGLMISIPFLFKDRIKKEVIEIVERNVDAKIYTSDVSLSLFRSFPHLNVSIEDFKIVNNDKTFTQPVVALKSLELDVNVSSLWKEKSIEILTFRLIEPSISLEVTKHGKANWDIVKASTEDETPAAETKQEGSTSDFGIDLEEVIIEQATISYIDKSAAITFLMNNFNLSLNGKMSGTNTTLNLETTSNVSCTYEDVAYLSHVPVELTTSLKADFDKMLFEIIESEMKIQSFPLVAQGTFQMDGDNYLPNIKIRCPHSSFAEVLGLVPDAYKSYLEGLDMTGKLTLNSTIEGIYNESTYPKFALNMEVKDGRMKYADLPQSVENIQLRAHITKAQGGLDLTKVNIPIIQMSIGQQPLKGAFSVSRPMSNPHFVTSFTGNIDLETLKQSLPVKMETLTGRIIANMKLQGNMAMIEKEEYDKLYMSGAVRVSGIKYKDKTLKYPIEIPKAGLDLTAQKITLNETQLKVKSDIISFTGYLQNYFPYIFKSKELKGNLAIRSRHIDTATWMNLMVDDSTENKSAVLDDKTKLTSSDTVVVATQIPKGLNIEGFLNIDEVKYDGILISDIIGKAKIKDQKAILSNLSMNLWDGSMVSNGVFNTQDANSPKFDFAFKANKIQITEAYRSSKTVQKYAPIAKESTGDISGNISLRGALDKTMSPIFKTFNGNGVISSSEIILKGTSTTKEIAKLFKNSSDQLKVSKFSANFDLVDGNLNLHPFNTKIAGQKLTFYGKQNLEGNMNYQCDFLIERDKLSNDIIKVVDVIPGASTIKEYNIGMKIVGTTSDPKVKLDLSKAKKQIQKELEKKAGKKVKQGLEDLGKSLKGLFK